MKVFLGGTCNDSTWRNELIPYLEAEKINYFNPVVEDWTSECQSEEFKQKEIDCDVHLYIITKEMTGVFSIAEAIDSAWQSAKFCIFQVIPDGFNKSQLKSLKAVAELIQNRNGHAYIGSDFNFIINWLKRIK